MNLNKVKERNSAILTCIIGVLLVSSFGISNLSFNNQALASVANNNDIDDTIKKSCPNYQGSNNNDVKSLVSGLLKACLGDNNQPPTTPNPDTTNFPNNVMTLQAILASNFDGEAEVVITDAASHYSNSYTLSNDIEPSVTDHFTIPVGDQYIITVTIDNDDTGTATFVSLACQQANPEIGTCTGTMGTSGQSVIVNIG